MSNLKRRIASTQYLSRYEIKVNFKNNYSIIVEGGEKYETIDGTRTRLFIDCFRYKLLDNTSEKTVDSDDNRFLPYDRILRILMHASRLK